MDNGGYTVVLCINLNFIWNSDTLFLTVYYKGLDQCTNWNFSENVICMSVLNMVDLVFWCTLSYMGNI